MKSTTIRKIALSQLDLSPKNVRKASVTKAEDEALEASIAAHGLQQNLGVEHAEDGRFLVYAGVRTESAKLLLDMRRFVATPLRGGAGAELSCDGLLPNTAWELAPPGSRVV